MTVGSASALNHTGTATFELWPSKEGATPPEPATLLAVRSARVDSLGPECVRAVRQVVDASCDDTRRPP